MTANLQGSERGNLQDDMEPPLSAEELLSRTPSYSNTRVQTKPELSKGKQKSRTKRRPTSQSTAALTGPLIDRLPLLLPRWTRGNEKK